MRITKRDALATAAVVAIVVPYVGYVIWGEMPFIKDARGMGATGIVLGAVAWILLGTKSFGQRWLAVCCGIVSLGLGVTAAALDTGTASDWFLGTFVASIVALWAGAMWQRTERFHHALFGQMRAGRA